MNVIWKFKVRPGDTPGPVEVEMPRGAEIISFGIQDGLQGDGPVVWALVDPAATMDGARRIWLVPTGWGALPPELRHVGTATDSFGVVIHAFEEVAS